MAERIIAQATSQGKGEGRRTTRDQRGIELFRLCADEIEHVEKWQWLVPSASTDGFYVVDLDRESCQCADRTPEDEVCKHIVAALIVRAKSGQCASCSRKFRYRDLYAVSDDHLTFFEGDLLCERCATAHGVL